MSTILPLSDRAIRTHAIVVADEMKTAYQGKKHGGYNIYEDESIRVCRDTFVPNLDIAIRMPEGWVLVYSAAYSSPPTVYHPGLWVEYLGTLADRALEDKARRAMEQEASKAAQQRDRYGPIDDSGLFADSKRHS